MPSFQGKLVGESFLHRRIMAGTEKHACPCFVVIQKQIHKDTAIFFIKGGSRFVGQNQERFFDNCSEKGDPLLFAAFFSFFFPAISAASAIFSATVR